MSPLSLVTMSTEQFREASDAAGYDGGHDERTDRRIAMVVGCIACVFGGIAALLVFAR